MTRGPSTALRLRRSSRSGRWPKPSPAMNTEAYARIYDNPFLAVASNPLSTFSIDVDTASYANVRRFLNGGPAAAAGRGAHRGAGQLLPLRLPAARGRRALLGDDRAWPPAPGSRRTSSCASASRRAAIDDETTPAAQPGLPGRRLRLDERPGEAAARCRRSMSLLVEQLTARDRVAIVVYAGASGLVLPPTPGRPQGRDPRRARRGWTPAARPTAARASSSPTRWPQDGFIEGGINRVILATDGDFNVGVTSEGDLVRLIEEKRKSGVFLTVLGFGMGNLKDSTHGEAGRQGQRQLRLHRHAGRGAQGARRADGGHARHRRQGREDPGRVQPGGRSRPTA